jgi:hypothetical protein
MEVVSKKTNPTSLKRSRPPVEEALLNQVLRATRAAQHSRPDLPAQPAHGPVELVQREFLRPRDAITFLPRFRRTVAARGKEPVQHREVNRPLQIEGMPAFASQIPHDFLKPHAFPQPPEHQVRPDLGDGHRLRLSGSMRVHDFDLFAVAQPAPHQAFKLPARLEDVEPAQRGDDLLSHCLAPPHTVGDLQVSVSFGGLDSEKHGSE